VWAILNDFHSAVPEGDTNSSDIKNMTLIETFGDGTNRYYLNMSGLINFSSNFTGPGPKGVYFCANDTFDRMTCSSKIDYFIKGLNVTDIERQFSGEVAHPDAGFSFSGADMRFANGTDIPVSSMIDFTTQNFSMVLNFTTDSGVIIVGMSINEEQFANASRTNFSDVVTAEVRSAAGTGFETNLTWVDIDEFIPDFASYAFGIIRMPGIYAKTYYCNGSSSTNPNCFQIEQCPFSNIGLNNHTDIIPNSSACFLTSGSWGANSTETNLSTGSTYLFVDHFSGGMGANDFSLLNNTFNQPSANINRTTALNNQLISFTITDINSTGLNLTKNGSINLTVYLVNDSGGPNQVLAIFSFVNHTDVTNLTCTTPDTVSVQNVTEVTCNTTFSFAYDGKFLINVTARDTSNNSNAVNTTGSFIQIIIDSIPPVFSYYNFTNSSSFNTSLEQGAAGVVGLGSGFGFSRAQGDAITGQIFAVANWTDNLTDANIGLLQFYNTSEPGWQTLNTTNVTGSNGDFRNGGWTNFSYPIPQGHNQFEGENVSFRIIANDSLGNVNITNVRNFTILINDTTIPDIFFNGTFAVNGTNISDTTPTISWSITENAPLRSINISFDDIVAAGTGTNACKTFAFYDTTDDPFNVENFRNSSFTIEDGTNCPLGNGSHQVNATITDEAGNVRVFGHTFTIETGSPTIVLSTLENGFSAVNQSNVSIYTGINFTVTNGGTGLMRNFSWTSSCNSSTNTISTSSTEFPAANLSFIYPFNYSGCMAKEANQTLDITVADDSGNIQTVHYSFLVDNLAPTLTINAPANEFIGLNNITINLSAQDGSQKISQFGYYLDGSSLVVLNASERIGESASSITNVFSRNFTGGVHTIKFTASDALGSTINNTVNTSITFKVIGTLSFSDVESSIDNYAGSVFGTNRTNVTIRIKNSEGEFQDITASNLTNNTFEIEFSFVDSTINVTMTEINGSAANWDKINFTPYVNQTVYKSGLENNFTITILNSTYFNNSLEEFLPDNNSYYGVVVMPLNISGTTATAQEFWWVEDEEDLITRVNISECTIAFTTTTTIPCWNYTSGGNTIIQVPHFSVVMGVNDSRPPTVTVNKPLGIQTEATFLANITVSNDAVLCNVSYDGGSARIVNATMDGPSTLGDDKICTFNINISNGTSGNNNISFYVFDANDNLNTTQFNFNVSDTTVHNLTSLANGTTGTITWEITITANESVNATINYSTSATLGGTGKLATKSDFAKSQTVSISSLTADTKYYFNITTCDKANNCIENGTFSFTTNAAAAATTTTTTTTTTSGGGGGGAAPVSNIADSKAQVWNSIPAGSSVSMNIDKATIAITKVAVNNVKSELSNVDIEVQALKANPVSVTAAGNLLNQTY